MKMISELIYGIRSWQLWYVNLAMCFQIISILLYFKICAKEYDSYDKQQTDVLFAVRLIFSSTALTLISVIAALGFSSYVGAIIGIVALILIFNIEKLPIWEKRKDE